MSERKYTTRSTAQRTQGSTRNTSSVKQSTRNALQASKTNTKNTSPTRQRTQRNNDDEYMTQSQATQSTGLTAEEENQLVGSVIRYLLAVDRTKHVIQRPQLVKNVFGTYNKHYRKIMTIVEATLTEVFGFNLVEFATGKYILTNAITINPPHLSCPESEKPRRILLILVLAHIFMLDGICKEELLWDFLRKLTIIPRDSFKTQLFGDVHKIITVEFVKQQYLEMPRIGSSDPPAYEFHWGVRAEEEVSKRHVLEFVSKMYNDRPIKSWPKQFNALNESERQSTESEDDN